VLNLSLIALQATASGASVIGQAGAVVDLDSVTLTATNTATGNNYVVQKSADGSFTIPIEGSSGNVIKLKAVDGSVYPLSSPLVTIGTLQNDTPAPSQIAKSVWTADTNFVPRILSRDGDYLVVSSYPATNGSSAALVVLGVADPAHPNHLRTAASPGGAIRDVVVKDGWAHFAANRLYTLNLADPNATPVAPVGSDAAGAEMALAVVGGLAFTSEVDWFNDGRIQVTDVSSPSQPRVFVGLQSTSEGVVFSAIVPYGTDYLYALSPNKSGNVGRDVVVIDRRDPFSLRKVLSIDIPNFDAFGGAISGTKLYLVSRSTPSLVVVDLANPAAPAVLATLTLPATANAVTIVGNDAFIAAGSTGLVTVDISNPAAPRLTDTTAVGGVAWDVEVIGDYAYIANELGLALVPAQTAPRVDVSRISLGQDSTTVTVTGAPLAVTGKAPVTLQVTNASTGQSVTGVAVQSNGSFTASLPGMPGHALTLTATDSAGRVAGPYPIGRVPFGARTKQLLITPEMKGNDTNFYARNVSADGNFAVVTSWEMPGNVGGSNKVLIFDVTQRANPLLQRTLLATGDARDVVVKDGWAYIGANRLYTLNLSDPNSTPIAPSGSDAAGAEQAIEIAGGFAYTSEIGWFNDGRIQVTDVSNPAAPRVFNGLQSTGSGVVFTSLSALGTDYLIGVSPYKSGSVGHDVVVLDRRDPFSLKKVADFDVPNFDALRGKVAGTRVILAGTTGGVATVDLSNPKAPQLVGITATPGLPRAVDVYGAVLAVADASSGVTFADLSGATPVVAGTQPVGGSAWETAFNGTTLYVANDSGLVVIDDLGTAPLVDTSVIGLSTAGSMVTVSGAANAVRGEGPLTGEVKNVRTQSSIGGIAVQSNGSFSLMIPGAAGDAMTVRATDALGRSSGPLPIGIVPFGSQSTEQTITPSMKLADTNFYARNVASHGNWTVVTSFEWPGNWGNSNKVLIYDVSNRANPVWQRTVQATGDARDVVVRDGWAYLGANRLYTLNLNDPNSVPIAPAGSDWAGSEQAIEIVGGLAFTAEIGWFNDGRIQVYDVSTPSAPRVLAGQQSTGSGVVFTSMSALGTDYLVATSPYKSGSVGHDVVVIDRRDPYAVKRIADLDIPNFDGFRGKVVGNRFYLTGGGGLAVVDVTVPTAPSLLGIVQTPGSPRSVDAFGAILAVSDGASGVTFLDISGTGLPVILGTQPAGALAWECAFNGATLYVASETGLTTLHDLGTAPLIDRNLIAAAGDGVATATVTGAAKSVLGVGPITLDVRNANSGVTTTVAVNPDGSFTASIAGTPGQALTVKATDGVGRVAGPVSIGTVPFGSATTSITITTAMSDSSFFARHVSADGNDLIVAAGDMSNKLVHFDVSTAGVPLYKRTIPTNNGNARDVLVRDGWAYTGADRLVTLNLTNPAATPNVVPSGDPAGGDQGIEVIGGYAFTSEVGWFNDGRVNVYDVSAPAAPKALGQHQTFSGVVYTDLEPLGHDYLVGISPYRTSNTIGHDVVVIDRRDIFKLKKVAELDIPNFDAVQGRVLDNKLYVTGVSSGVAVVDLTSPAAPVHVTTLGAPAAARALEIAGSTLAVANGTNGVTMVDVTAAPTVLGAHATPGHAWEVALSRGAMYVATDTGLTAVRNVALPPMLDDSQVTVSPAATETTVTGAAQALTGIAPLTVQLLNDATGTAGSSVAVNASGAFSVSVAATPGQPLSLKAVDAAGRIAVRKLGVSFGVTTTHAANQSVSGVDYNFNARRVASDGNFTFTSTGSYFATPLPTTTNLLLFRPGSATTVVPTSGGLVSDVEISGGFAFVGGDRLGTIQLSDPTLATKLPGTNNAGWDIAIALIGNYAVTAEAGWFNDGRVNVYNVTNPAAPVTMRQQRLATASTVYRSLVAMGTGYLIAISPDKPGNVGHDINVIDVTNIDNFVLKVDLDIAGIDAIDGTLDGTTLYLTGIDGALAIVDMANPLAPVVKSVTKTPGNSRGIAVSGTNELVVADATTLTFINVADKAAPVVTGRQKLAGNIADVRVVGKTIYVAAENYYHTIQRP
jgi:hypothetical protein